MPRKPDGVLVLHNVPRPGTGGRTFAESDAGVLAEVRAVTEALRKLNIPYRVAGVRELSDLPRVLRPAREGVVFNLVESLSGGPADALLVPALCRAMGKACTGGDTPSLLLAQDKWLTKSALSAHGLPCPRGMLVAVDAPPPTKARRKSGVAAPGPRSKSGLPPGRLIVKPVSADASEGIDAASVVPGPGAALERAVRRVHRRFGQAALVEQFVEGRELNVSLLQRGRDVHVLPLAEIDFSAFAPGRLRIVDYAAKWLRHTFEYRNTNRIIPVPVGGAVARRVRGLALAAWHALGCRDYVRVDFRLDEKGRAFILEVNPNPDISPDAGFAAALAAGGIAFEEFIRIVVGNAEPRPVREIPNAFLHEAGPLQWPRIGSERTSRRHRATEVATPQFTIRRPVKSDRDAILKFVTETGFFRDDEIAVAREVLDDALAKGPDGHYQSYTAHEAGRPVGWICFGPTPCTLGTFDIYWIVVARERQGRGVGAALLRLAEDLIARRGGRITVLETSSRGVYTPPRHL
jgi:D-alanine-D-alanine ligase